MNAFLVMLVVTFMTAGFEKEVIITKMEPVSYDSELVTLTLFDSSIKQFWFQRVKKEDSDKLKLGDTYIYGVPILGIEVTVKNKFIKDGFNYIEVTTKNNFGEIKVSEPIEVDHNIYSHYKVNNKFKIYPELDYELRDGQLYYGEFEFKCTSKSEMLPYTDSKGDFKMRSYVVIRDEVTKESHLFYVNEYAYSVMEIGVLYSLPKVIEPILYSAKDYIEEHGLDAYIENVIN